MPLPYLQPRFAAYGADFLKNDDCGVVYANSVRDYGAMQRALAAVSRPMLHNVKAPDLPAQARTRPMCTHAPPGTRGTPQGSAAPLAGGATGVAWSLVE